MGNYCCSKSSHPLRADIHISETDLEISEKALQIFDLLNVKDKEGNHPTILSKKVTDHVDFSFS